MRRFSEAERAEIWDAFECGESERTIALRLGRSKGSIRTFLIDNAGRRPRPPGCSDLRLTLAEREEISRGLATGRSLRAIAADMRRAPSTVCREVKANGGRAHYRALSAERSAAAGPVARRWRSWPDVTGCAGWWRRGSRTTGRPRRSRRGWLSSTETTRRCR
jgi:IS30 family transposase